MAHRIRHAMARPPLVNQLGTGEETEEDNKGKLQAFVVPTADRTRVREYKEVYNLDE